MSRQAGRSVTLRPTFLADAAPPRLPFRGPQNSCCKRELFRLCSPPFVRKGDFQVHLSVAFFIHVLTVGTEWLIEASGCDAGRLRDVGRLRAVFARAVGELGLRVVSDPLWHKFPGEGGVTGLLLLTESHLACHTYPEFGVATFNLYCCRERPSWPWDERLREMLGASAVSVRRVRRAPPAPAPAAFESSANFAPREGEA